MQGGVTESNMNRKSVFVALACLLAAWSAAASDFSAVAPTGQTLYYNIVSGGVEVTFPVNTTQQYNGWEGYTRPTGALTVPSTVTNAGTTYSVVAVHGFAFYECTGLTSVTLPEGVATIGNSTFNGCTMLQQITLPSTLVQIGGAAFYACTALSAVNCHATVPPSAVNSTFQNSSIGSCVLNVPCLSAGAYASTTPWSSFGSIMGENCTATISVAANYAQRGTVTGGGTYSADTVVTLTAVPAEGYFFACWSDGDTLNPRLVTLTADTLFTAWFFECLHDTVQVHDTTEVHDTVTMVVVHEDTVFVHDTTIVTMLMWDTVVVHDTVAIEGTDTLYVHDTTTVYDTLLPTFFRLQVMASEGGVGIGNGVLPAGTVAEIGALPLEGYRFVGWDDGNTDNPRQVTLMGNSTYGAMFESLMGIEEVVVAWGLSVDGQSLVVECEAGETVSIYSADGRRLMQHTMADRRLRVWMPAAGVYLVQVGSLPARKVVITK